jgi:hypothetical protein
MFPEADAGEDFHSPAWVPKIDRCVERDHYLCFHAVSTTQPARKRFRPARSVKVCFSPLGKLEDFGISLSLLEIAWGKRFVTLR